MEIEAVNAKLEARCAYKCGRFVRRHAPAIKCKQRTRQNSHGTPFTYHVDCFIESAGLALMYAKECKEKINQHMDQAGVHRQENNAVQEGATRVESPDALGEKARVGQGVEGAGVLAD